MIVSVIVDIKNSQVNKQYDYYVPEAWYADIAVGMRVIVPFGNQTRLAIVIDILESSEQATKYIESIIDLESIFTKETWLIYEQLLKDNFYLYQQVLETIIPPELWVTYEKIVIPTVQTKTLPLDMQTLFKRKQQIAQKDISSSQIKDVKKYLKDGRLRLITRLKPKATPKTKLVVKMAFDHVAYPSNYTDLVEFVKEHPKGIFKTTLLELGFSDSSIKTLIKKGVLMQEKQQVFRESNILFPIDLVDHPLNDDQKNVINDILSSPINNQTFLLHGVAGSGKTKVYIEVIKSILSQGKTILYLVPQISLVSQTYNQLKQIFPERIAVFHSYLSKGERYDNWHAIMNQDAKIIIGTKSAVMLPFQNLGLIVVDECHNEAYIETFGVKYDAIKITELLAKSHQAMRILGSATPSVVQYYLAKNETYQYLLLPKRADQLSEIDVHIADMRQELIDGNTSILSRELKTKMVDAIKNKKQIILLYNKKGYAPFVMCRRCGTVRKCPHCDISLTYFKEDNKLKCRYCSYEEPFHQTCDVCHTNAMKSVGIGIEYIEAEIKKIFPEETILRMDKETTAKRGNYERIWYDFMKQKASILIGTQMIAKGLNFDHVSLVGVLMADMLYKVPSHKANEEAYILLKQVIGRISSGIKGQAVIQTYDTKHPVIQSLRQPESSFYQAALEERKLLKYEPYFYVSQVVISGQSYFKTYQEAYRLKESIQTLVDYCLGPSELLIKKKNDVFRFSITIKNKTKLSSKAMEMISNQQKNGQVKITYYPYIYEV